MARGRRAKKRAQQHPKNQSQQPQSGNAQPAAETPDEMNMDPPSPGSPPEPPPGIPTPVPGVDDGYGNMHKIVLQGMLSAGVLDASGIKKLFYGACAYLKVPWEERTGMAYICKIMYEINDITRPLDFIIKSVVCELTGTKYYIFLVASDKPILKMQTLFSPFERELFNRCLRIMLAESDTYCVPMYALFKYAIETQMHGTIQDAENFVARMISMKYFARVTVPGVEEYSVTLGFRGIREFEPFLREHFGEVFKICYLCKVVMLHGFACSGCKLPVHRGCYRKYMRRTIRDCPNCSCDWSVMNEIDRGIMLVSDSDIEEEALKKMQSKMEADRSDGGSIGSGSELSEPIEEVNLVPSDNDSNASFERMVRGGEPVAGPSSGKRQEFVARNRLMRCIEDADSDSD